MEDPSAPARSNHAPTAPGGSPYRHRPDAEEAAPPNPEAEADRADLVAWVACAAVGAGAFIERGHVGGAVSLALLAVVAIPWGARDSLQAAWRRVAPRLGRRSQGKR